MRVKVVLKHGEVWRYRIICIACGDAFFATRSDAKTCSDRCRKKLQRRRERNARKKHRDKCVQLGLFPPATKWDINKVEYNL